MLLGVLQERTTREARHAARRATASAGDVVVAAERNIESVGALSMTPHLADRWQRLMAARGDERERTEGRLAFFSFLKSSLRQILYIGAIGVGVWLVLQNILTLGGIFAARIMLGFGYRLVDRAVDNWRSLRDANASYLAIKQQLRAEDRPPASVDGAARGDALILEEVSFRYRDQRDSVIRNLSLTLEPGEALLVTGTATTGKTTLSRLLVGLLEPRHGQVRLGDVEIARLPVEMRADLIGYLPQHTELFSGTVRENIARMRQGDFEAIVAAAKLIDIHETIIRLPEGYDTVISGETVGLSGSEFKRIAIARAIYGQPRLLVLDEPAANLDRPSRRTLEAAIVALKQQGCSVVITQAMQSARTMSIADKFLILGGRNPEYSVGRPAGRRLEARQREAEPAERHMTAGAAPPPAAPVAGPPFGLGQTLLGLGIIAAFLGCLLRLVDARAARERGGRARRGQRRNQRQDRAAPRGRHRRRDPRPRRRQGRGRRRPDPAAEHPARVRPERGPGAVLRGARHRGPPGGRARRQGRRSTSPTSSGAGWPTRRCRTRSPARRASSAAAAPSSPSSS